jgi:ribonuclease HII
MFELSLSSFLIKKKDIMESINKVNLIDLYVMEETLHQKGYSNIVGLDEAGRGPMAGPLVAAAVMLPKGLVIKGLNDSKKLSESKRNLLYDEIMSKATEVKVEIVSSDDVDLLNVYQASKIAMENCIKAFQNKIDFCLTDAMKLDTSIPYEAIIKGDAKVAAIAAASIIAKVTRDRIMHELDELYPQYGFKKHKGYVTKEHLLKLSIHGPIAAHRRSFGPVKKYLK